MGIVDDMKVARAAQQAMDVLRVAADAFSEGYDGPLGSMTIGDALRVAYDHAVECEVVPGTDDPDGPPPFALLVALGAMVTAQGDAVLIAKHAPQMAQAMCEDAVGILASSMDEGVAA